MNRTGDHSQFSLILLLLILVYITTGLMFAFDIKEFKPQEQHTILKLEIYDISKLSISSKIKLIVDYHQIYYINLLSPMNNLILFAGKLS